MKQCNHLNDKGHKCQNGIGHYQEYCWRHFDMKFNIQIKKSGIPRAGLGLFAGHLGFSKGDVIGRYSFPHNYVDRREQEKLCKASNDYDGCWEKQEALSQGYLLCDRSQCTW